MNNTDIAYFRDLLLKRQADLRTDSGASADKRKPVELDQQSVGRLSRQDALQQQAMQNAQEGRRNAEIKKIDVALARIDDGEFGYCAECGEEIARARLEIDATIARCVTCAA